MAATSDQTLDTGTVGEPFMPSNSVSSTSTVGGGGGGVVVITTTTTTKSPFMAQTTAAQNFSVILLNTGLGDLVTRAVFLGVFTVLGFISNCILLATLAQSNRRRLSSLNLLLISLASVNLVDCLLNMPLVLGASITQQWDYGEVMCRINAFSVQFVSMATIVALCALSVDRCVGVHATAKYNEIMTLTKVNLLIIYTWVQGAALSFPLVANIISTSTLQARYLCSVSGGNSVLYICLSSTIGFILPILLICSIFISITCKNFKERKRKRKRKMEKNYQKAMVIDRTLRKEINTSKFVGVLFMLWCVLQGPYLLLSYLQQYSDSGYGTISYPWQVDLSLTWIRFSYPIFLPLVTFCWRRDVWHKFKTLCLCRKGNLIDDESMNGSPAQRGSFTVTMDGGNGKKDKSTLAFDIPVLFATEQGLHVQTLSKRPKGPRTPITPEHFEDDPFAAADDLGESQASGVVTARKCDVGGSQDLLQIDDDTSDYDSVVEGDLLAVSHPTGDDLSNFKPKTSTSSRHDSEIMLIAESQKSYDNDAFEPDQSKRSSDSKRSNRSKQRVQHVKQNSKDSTEGQFLGKGSEVLLEDDKSMRHVRSSSDSGRGSEEGTMPRREKTEKTTQPSALASLQAAYTNLDDVTTNETSTDIVGRRPSALSLEMSEEQPKVKKKKRKRKKALRDEESEQLAPEERNLPNLSERNQDKTFENDFLQGRPPIRLKPIEKPPSPVPVHVSPQSKLPKKLPSPYKSSRTGSASSRSPSKTKADYLQGEDTASLKQQQQHQRSDSEASAILEVEPAAPSGRSANMAARRRRTQTLTKVTLPDSLAQSDVTDGLPRDRHGSSSSEPSHLDQRLTHSDSAADIRSLTVADAAEVTRRSPRPSPRPRRPRRKSDIPKADGKPPIGAH